VNISQLKLRSEKFYDDDDDDDSNNNNNNNNVLRVFSVADDICLLNWLERPLAKPRPRWRMDVRRIGCGVD
jgi:hypothetical protein